MFVKPVTKSVAIAEGAKYRHTATVLSRTRFKQYLLRSTPNIFVNKYFHYQNKITRANS